MNSQQPNKQTYLEQFFLDSLNHLDDQTLQDLDTANIIRLGNSVLAIHEQFRKELVPVWSGESPWQISDNTKMIAIWIEYLLLKLECYFSLKQISGAEAYVQLAAKYSCLLDEYGYDIRRAMHYFHKEADHIPTSLYLYLKAGLSLFTKEVIAARLGFFDCSDNNGVLLARRIASANNMTYCQSTSFHTDEELPDALSCVSARLESVTWLLGGWKSLLDALDTQFDRLKDTGCQTPCDVENLRENGKWCLEQIEGFAKLFRDGGSEMPYLPTSVSSNSCKLLFASRFDYIFSSVRHKLLSYLFGLRENPHLAPIIENYLADQNTAMLNLYESSCLWP